MSPSASEYAPIVLLANEHTPFAEYLAEILYTEGLPWFQRAATWGQAAAAIGGAHALLIPHGAGGHLPTVQAWLDAGATVAAIRPPDEIALLAGVEPLGRVAAESPLLLAPPFDAGRGRAHGDADLWRVEETASAHVLAQIVSNGESYPAVVSAACGRGRLVVFAYDLPRSIALTRQGNPAWVGARGTDFGSNTFRPADLFVRRGGAETWLDFPHAGAPIADLQQRLLAAAIEAHSPAPLPRLWYLPHAARTVLCVLGDSDGSEPEVVQEQLDDVAAAGGCMSAFLIDYSVDRADAETVARWRAAGHEITVHPDYGLHGDKASPDAETMRVAQATIRERFRRKFGFAPRTVRNHSAAWAGYAEQAEVERRVGFRLDSIYVYSAAFQKPPYHGPAAGYLTGSGQPQKFADEQGRVLDIYQLATEVCDEMLKPKYLGYDMEAGWAAAKALLDASLQRWHSYIGLSFHPITHHRNPDARRWLRDRILPYARNAGAPLWSAEQVLDFADARRACRIENAEWTHGLFRCELHAPSADAGLTLMMPARAQGRRLATLTVDADDAPECDTELAAGAWRLAPVERERSEIVARYG